MFKWLRLPRKAPGIPAAASEMSSLPPAPVATHPEQASDSIEEAPLYPPSDRGIPFEPLAKVLDKQHDLIARIHRAAGVAPEAFEALYLPSIRNLAAYVHLLPATDTAYFVGAGGLVRLSLEIGLHSLQTSHASVFPMAGVVETRSILLPKWELATFLAALCSQLYRPIANMVVTDRSNNQWPQLLMPLSEWGQSVQATRYFVRWAAGEDTASRQNCAALLIGRIIPPAVLQYLNEDNNVIVPAMTAAISGGEMNPSANPIARIVAPIMTRVIKDDVSRNSRHYGNYSLGIHLEPHLIDAMRRLLKSGKWAVNNKGARIWVGKDGTYIVWSAGAKEIVNLLTADSFVGLPQDPDTLADILTNANVLVRNAAGGRYWTITLPETGTLIDNAVKLSNELLLFPLNFNFAALRTTSLSVDSPFVSDQGEAQSAENEAPAKKRRRKQDNAGSQPEQGDIAHSQHLPALSNHNQQQQSSQETPNGGTTTVKNNAVSTLAKAETVAVNTTSDISSQRNSTSANAGASIAPRSTNDSTPAEKADVKITEVNEKYLLMLSRESQWLAKQIAKAQVKGTLTGIVVNLDIGLGISAEELSAHGMPTTDFLNDLAARNWLWVDKTKPLKKVHRVEVDGKMQSLIILQPHVARGMGFEWQAPKTNGESE